MDKIHKTAGGDGWAVESGGVATVKSGGSFIVESGATAIIPAQVLDIAVTAITLKPVLVGKFLRTTSASATTITVPTDAAVPGFDIGTQFTVRQNGDGQVTFAAALGVTINSAETLKTAKKYATVILMKDATDTWTLSGNLEAAV